LASLWVLSGPLTMSWTNVSLFISIRIFAIMTFIYSVTLLICMITKGLRSSIEYVLGSSNMLGCINSCLLIDMLSYEGGTKTLWFWQLLSMSHILSIWWLHDMS
jgi:hypothetical protein